MKIGKVLIISLILMAFLLSAGGVFAEEMEENMTDVQTMSSVDVSCNSSDSEMLLEDTLYANNQDNLTSSNKVSADFSSDVDYGVNTLTVSFTDKSKGNPTSWLWDFGDGSNSTLKNPKHTYNSIGYFDVSLKISNGDSNDIIVKKQFIHVQFERDVISNPDFELDSKPVGWQYSAVSVYSYGKYAKNGKKFLSMSNNGYISQNVNFDSIDSISFWYSSESKSSNIDVLIDDKTLLTYSVDTVGMGKWGIVSLDVSKLNGGHSFKLVQHNGTGYVDFFTWKHNNDISANFSLTSFTLADGNLTLNFNDYSCGLIDGWLWDFGDGTGSTSQNVTHSYRSGHYTVVLTVYNKYTRKNATFDLPITLPTIVRTNGEYSTVQEAIRDAIDGDTINVYNNIFYSTYLENIVVDKSVTLNFFNCTLTGDGINPLINVVNGASVNVINVLFDEDVILKTDNSSKLSIDGTRMKSINLIGGNIDFNSNAINGNLTITNTTVNIQNSHIDGAIRINNSSSVINHSFISNCDVAIYQIGGKSLISSNSFANVNYAIVIDKATSEIYNNTINHTDAAITQIDGVSNIVSNMINNNTIGVNISKGSCNLSFNSIYYNDIGLLYYCEDVLNVNNWWGKNNPRYSYYFRPLKSDVCKIAGVKTNIPSWLVFKYSQNLELDSDYYIAGITYYNITLDLTHNNLGEDTSSQGHVKDFRGCLEDNSVFYYSIYHNAVNPYYTNHSERFVGTLGYFDIVNGRGEGIFTWNHLTSNSSSLNFTFLKENYTIGLLTDDISPKITYITPVCQFEENLTVEIITNDTDAVIFYTIDGTNPAYSSTRMKYEEPILINESVTLHYAVIDHYGNFEKFVTDYADNPITKQDVFFEIYGDDKCFYTLDGSDPSYIDWYYGTFHHNDNGFYYVYPFVVRNLTEIRYVNPYPYTATYSYLESSVNYLKNTTFINDESGAIWSQYQGNNHNTGVSNYTGPITNQSSWFNDNFAASGSAVVDKKGHIYVGGSDGYLYCLNTQGLVIWRFGTTSRIICTPTIGPDGNIYFSNWMDSNAYCITPDGQLVWKCELGDYNTGTSPVFGLDGRLYIITSTNSYSTVYVFKDGVLVGNHSIPSFISGSTPVVGSDGTLYMLSANHEIVVVNWDGTLRFSKYLSHVSDNNPQNPQNSISLGENDTLYLTIETCPSGTPTLYNDMIFITASDGIYSLSVLNKSMDYGYLIEYDYVVFYQHNNKVMVNSELEKLIGTNAYYTVQYNTEWARVITNNGNTLSSPLIACDGVVYATSGNSVYAFNYLTGERIWEYTLSGIYGNPISFSSPTLTDDGTLIVTTNQGVYAFNDIGADFTYSHVEGTSSTIQFKDLSTPGNNRYYWMFGDGNVSREQNPIHEYAEGGKYRVVLLVEHNGINLARNTTIRVAFKDIVPPSNVTAYINNNVTNGGVFNNTQWVTLNATDDFGFTIYYTVDGSNPMNSSTRREYAGKFDIEVDTILTMVARDDEGNWGNLTNITFVILDAYRFNTALVSEIQALLDAAEPGSKFVFDYSELYGANFTITKPLNLISNNNTKLFGNGVQPVFTFTKEAEGSILNGFTINNDNAYGILINDTSDVAVRNCFVGVTNSTGIYINSSESINVFDTHVFNAIDGIIVNNSRFVDLNNLDISESYNNGVLIFHSNRITLSNSHLDSNGKDQYRSKANQVLVDDASSVYILNNTINSGFIGVHLYNVGYVVIDRNFFNETVCDAITLSKNYTDVNITHNLIDGCYNGIDFMGYSENVLIKQNTIKNLHQHPGDFYNPDIDPDDVGYHHQAFRQDFTEFLASYVYEEYIGHDRFFNHQSNGIQISDPASNFDEGNTIIIDNVVIKCSHRPWEARKYHGVLDAGCAGYGYNLMDSFGLHEELSPYREGKVDLVIDRVGDAAFRMRLINRLDNHYLTEIPEFDVTFTTGGFSQTVKFIDSEAVAVFDVSMALSDVIVKVDSYGISKTAHFDVEIAEGYKSTNREYDPGYEAGEAINNPDPIAPPIPPEKDDKPNVNPNPYAPEPYTPQPQTPDPQTPDIIDTGEGHGNGSGNGDGNGNGRFDGNGNGSAMGQGDGTHGTGTTNIKGRQGQTADNLNELAESFMGDLDPVGVESAAEGSDVSIEGESSGGEGETAKAYEVTKEIKVEEVNEFTFAFILIFAILAVIAGYIKKRYYEGGEI